MSRRKRDVTSEEQKLWSRVTRDVTPLGSRPSRAKPADVEATAPEGDQSDTPGSARQKPPQARPNVGAKPAKLAKTVAEPAKTVAERFALSGPVAGLDRRSADRLRRGQLPIEARLDLHGMTQEVALRSLSEFILACAAAGRRCVLVITGKGGRDRDETAIVPERSGVLRAQVPRWLAAPALARHIIAVRPSARRHGGEGALYVLLKRAKS